MTLFIKLIEYVFLSRISIFYNTAIATIVFIVLGVHKSGYYFRGGDGQYFANIIDVNLNFSQNPFFSMPVSPFEGMGGAILPLNVWLSPSFLAYAFVSDGLIKVLLPFVIFGILIFLSVYLLGRASNFSRFESLGGAWLGALVAAPFTRFSSVLGMYGIPHLQIFILGTFATVAFLALGRSESWWKNIVLTIVVIILIFWALLFSSTYAVIGGATFSLIALGIFLTLKKRKEIVWKFSCVLIFGIFFLILSFDEYILGLAAYSGRIIFANEMLPAQGRTYAIAIFKLTALGFMSIGAIFAIVLILIQKNDRFYSLAIGTAIPFVVLVAASIFTLIADGGTLPHPYQFEFYLIGGYALFVSYIVLRVAPGLIALIFRNLNFPKLSMRKTMVASVIVLSATFAFVFRYPIYAAFSGKSVKLWSTDRTEMSDFLEANIAIRPGDKWRGVAVSFIGNEKFPNPDRAEKTYGEIRPFFGNGHADYELRNFSVPVLESTGPYLSSTNFLFITRLLRRGIYPNPKSYLYVNRFRPRLLRAMGVRYVVDDVANIRTGWKPVKSLSSENNEKTLYLYDLNDPNVGNYSPTNVIVNSTPEKILALMDDRQFDFRKKVILDAPLKTKLVPVEKSELFIEKSGYRVEAVSNGTSLLTIPLQYSSCLEWESISENAAEVSLVQANLIHTGLLFKGKIDGHLVYRYGPLSRSNCRRNDAKKLKEALGL